MVPSPLDVTSCQVGQLNLQKSEIRNQMDVTSCKVGELNLRLVSRLKLFHLFRHEKSFSDGVADETVRLFSFLGYKAPQNSTGMGFYGHATYL